MRVRTIGCFWVFCVASLGLVSCVTSSTATVSKAEKTGYSGIQCPTTTLMVDQIVLSGSKAFCNQGQDTCFDGLVQLHNTSQNNAFLFLILDRTHRTTLRLIEDVLTDAHNRRKPVKITFAPEQGVTCGGNPPMLLEKDIVTVEIMGS